MFIGNLAISHSIPCMHQAKPSKCHLRCFHHWCFIYLHILLHLLCFYLAILLQWCCPFPQPTRFRAWLLQSRGCPAPTAAIWPKTSGETQVRDGDIGISYGPMAWSQPLKQFSLLWMNHSSHITKALFFWGVIDVDWWRLISHLIHRSGTLGSLLSRIW